ncbi:PaaI family thioesterase [Paenibacillus popilliae]|uniref:PaaI family thioesterase n=1 Tax=Paenibacillus popilliae TaxID=78057 RepID=UPI00163C123B|nr:PaaI family thioesterase [Paenibacillus sp. SDF0028]
MTILEHYRKVLDGELEQSPVESLMGLKLISVEEGEATYEMQASEQHANPQGTCNGGSIGILADMAMGIALCRPNKITGRHNFFLVETYYYHKN